MPNNCSTLIQRKQNILHKVLRSNSDGKMQNAVTETTAELCVAGTAKTPGGSPHSTRQFATVSGAGSRRPHMFNSNRVQPSTNDVFGSHLPSIRDTNDHAEHQHQPYDQARNQSKKPSTNASPKSTGRPPSTSISSIFNALTKRSTENFMSTYGEFEEAINPSTAATSRRLHQQNKGIEANQSSTKQTGDNKIENRLSNSSGDINQQRTPGSSIRLRTNPVHMSKDSPPVQEPSTKERNAPGQLYQRRTNHTIKAPAKNKIDKYRRRSEEVTQATNGNTLTNAANNGLSGTTSSLVPSPLTRSKQATPSPTAVRRVASDAELEARLEVLRLSMDANFMTTEQEQLHTQTHKSSRNRAKSPYSNNFQHPTNQKLPIANSPTPPVHLRRNPRQMQPLSSASSSRQQNAAGRQTPHQHFLKKTIKPSAGNLYLAFIASRHYSAFDEALLVPDIDHQKIYNIFTWLRSVDEHRHEIVDHDQLLNEQNQRMLEQEDDLSLYSELQFAVDDVPANTTGKPCEKIKTMQFED